MSIPMLVEKAANGFRAIAGGPFDLSADAASADEAIAALRAKIDVKLQNGAVLVEQFFTQPPLPIAITPLAENPLFDAWLKAVDEYRAEKDAADNLAG